jgi:c-di-GMP-binding flagellar brake protein YcgR
MMRPLAVVDCSSLGVGFIASNSMATGDYLRIDMKLRATPAIHIECMGCIVRCMRMERQQDGPERYDVGVRFTHIHESDRERLIHHLFKVQRRLLRDRKEALELGTGTNS